MMPLTIKYDRDAALSYARTWAFSRNPAFMNFNSYGGDCTNFCSQCLLVGGGVMNFQRHLGWYYRSPSQRSPSWSGVRFFHEFLIHNRTIGPYAEECEIEQVQPADFVQLGNGTRFYHTLIITQIQGGQLLVAAHSQDVYDRPLNHYTYQQARYLRIVGIRQTR